MYHTTSRDGGLIAVPRELTKAWNRRSSICTHALLRSTCKAFLILAEIRAEDGEPARCGSSSPPQGDAGNATAGWLDLCTLDRMRPSKSLLKLHRRALGLIPGMAVSHSNGRQQRAEEASLVRLVIRARQVRGGRADLVQGNGILLCVG